MSIQMEHLDRGLAAVCTSEGIFISWRLLGQEVSAATDSGLIAADFRIYRNGERIAEISDSTNYLDTSGSREAEYAVAAVIDGEEKERCVSIRPWETPTWKYRCRSQQTELHLPVKRTRTAQMI